MGIRKAMMGAEKTIQRQNNIYNTMLLVRLGMRDRSRLAQQLGVTEQTITTYLKEGSVLLDDPNSWLRKRFQATSQGKKYVNSDVAFLRQVVYACVWIPIGLMLAILVAMG